MSSILSQKVSVILPTYNHAKYLSESIESILSQTHRNIELVVVDDGSTDNTQEVLGDYGDVSNVVCVYLDNNQGKWNALNEGIAASTGEWITSHDADDISLTDRIERQLLCLQETQTVHNLCGFFHCFSEDDIKKHGSYRPIGTINFMPPDTVRAAVMTGFHHPHVNHFYTGEFETAGVTSMFHRSMWLLGMRFNPPGLGLRVMLSEDSDFNFRLTSLLGRTSVLEEKLYLYRRGTSTNKEEF